MFKQIKSAHLAGILLALPLTAHAFSFDPYVVAHAIYGDEESVAIGDVTGDGRDDLVMTSGYYFDPANDYHVFIREQLADGTLAPPVQLPYQSTANRTGLVLADLDGDGRKEIVVGHSQGITLVRRAADGSYAANRIVAPRAAEVLAALDVDRDGATDIVGLSWGNGATVFHGDGLGGIARQSTLASGARGYNDLEAGDVNGDGLADLVVTSLQGSAVLEVHEHDGIAGFLPPLNYGPGERADGVAIGDFNHDGRNDIAAARSANSPTHVWLYSQDAVGGFGLPQTLGTYDIPGPMVATDADGDGRQDLLVLHNGWNRLGFYPQGASGLGAEILVPIPYATWYNPQGLATGDVNGDGCTDVAIADYNQGWLLLHGRDCVPPSADLALSAQASAAGAALQTTHAGGAATARAVTLRVTLRPSKASVKLQSVPSVCVPAPATGFSWAFDCVGPDLAPGATWTLDFGLRGKNASVVVSASVQSATLDPVTGNNSVAATIRL